MPSVDARCALEVRVDRALFSPTFVTDVTDEITGGASSAGYLDVSLPVQALTAKELQLRGSFRFHAEFFTGVSLMRKGLIDVKPLITHTLPLADAVQAFRVAGDRGQAIKAQIAFDYPLKKIKKS